MTTEANKSLEISPVEHQVLYAIIHKRSTDTNPSDTTETDFKSVTHQAKITIT